MIFDAGDTPFPWAQRFLVNCAEVYDGYGLVNARGPEARIDIIPTDRTLDASLVTETHVVWGNTFAGIDPESPLFHTDLRMAPLSIAALPEPFALPSLLSHNDAPVFGSGRSVAVRKNGVVTVMDLETRRMCTIRLDERTGTSPCVVVSTSVWDLTRVRLAPVPLHTAKVKEKGYYPQLEASRDGRAFFVHEGLCGDVRLYHFGLPVDEDKPAT